MLKKEHFRMDTKYNNLTCNQCFKLSSIGFKLLLMKKPFFVKKKERLRPLKNWNFIDFLFKKVPLEKDMRKMQTGVHEKIFESFSPIEITRVLTGIEGKYEHFFF